MNDDPVLAATAWTTNAHMIADVARLGYLQPDDRVLDPTYGKGVWWQEWRPKNLMTHDLRDDGVDFRNLPYSDGHFDAVAYDPPYVCVGGRATTTVPDLHDRFGLTDAPRTPAAVQQLVNDGLTEVARVVKRSGIVLVKCQDYVWGGKLWAGTYKVIQHGERVGLTLEDRLEHISGIRPQPPGRRQVHARRNLSTLLIFRS